MKISILFCGFFLMFAFLKAQDTIQLLNGKIMTIKDYEIDETQTYMLYKHKGKTKSIDFEYIYSIKDSTGKTTIYYKPDSVHASNETPLTVEQMGFFIEGQKLANTNYKAPLATIGGFVVGSGSAYFPLLGRIGFAPIYPTAYTSIVGLTNPSKKSVLKKYPEQSKNEFFIYGYQEAAKVKRTKNAIKGGVIGLVVGITSRIIISSLTDSD